MSLERSPTPPTAARAGLARETRGPERWQPGQPSSSPACTDAREYTPAPAPSASGRLLAVRRLGRAWGPVDNLIMEPFVALEIVEPESWMLWNTTLNG